MRSILTLCALATTAPTLAAPTALPIDQVAAQYVQPHQRIEVEPGRRMNLFCLGEGSPTVVFDSGLSDWSNTWALIQPAVATRTRACSYDRAGMGYSDPAERPATPLNAVRDLHALLEGAKLQGAERTGSKREGAEPESAGLKGPFVLVGHSLGGFHAKLYAATYPDEVAGLVLVDPAEERLWDRVGPDLTPRFGAKLVREARADDEGGIREAVKHFRECAEKTRKDELDDALYAKCTDPVRVQLGPVINAERRKLQAQPAYQDAQAGELEHCMYVPNEEADAHYAKLFAKKHLLGNRPLLVLTHSQWEMTPPFGETGWQSYLAAHRQTATLSTRGEQRMVPMTRHNIQVDQPQAVIDAISEVLDTLNP